jgi:hypothetical protein
MSLPDTSNQFGVIGTKTPGEVVIMQMPLVQEVLTRERALNLAAWLIAIADNDREPYHHATVSRMVREIETAPAAPASTKGKKR